MFSLKNRKNGEIGFLPESFRNSTQERLQKLWQQLPELKGGMFIILIQRETFHLTANQTELPPFWSR